MQAIILVPAFPLTAPLDNTDLLPKNTFDVFLSMYYTPDIRV